MHYGGEQPAQAVALDAFGNFGVGGGEGLAERVRYRRIRTRVAGGFGRARGFGRTRFSFSFGTSHNEGRRKWGRWLIFLRGESKGLGPRMVGVRRRSYAARTDSSE